MKYLDQNSQYFKKFSYSPTYVRIVQLIWIHREHFWSLSWENLSLDD